MLCGCSFIYLFLILTLKFTCYTDDLPLALFFVSYRWLLIPAEWSLSPNVGSRRMWDLTLTQFCPISFWMAVLTECIPRSRT